MECLPMLGSPPMKTVLALACLAAFCFAGEACAEWKAASPEVELAAKDPAIAAVLEAVNKIDSALVSDNHEAFAALLDSELAVNNPQNAVSVRGATASRNAAGLISYSRYDRRIEYAGKRGDFVVLMG